MEYLVKDTIVAVATPRGAGAIGIVRLSGPEAHGIAKKFFVARSLATGRAITGKVVDPEGGMVLDTAVMLLFSGPRSYTGEDVAEIQCHGSRPMLSRIVEMMIGEGARPAQGGEFTFRAYMNGRLDLAQSEAVNRMIMARTLEQARNAARQLEGAVGEELSATEEKLHDLIARLQAAVDFADEDEDYLQELDVSAAMAVIEKRLGRLKQGFATGDLLRDGAVVAIAGGANVGKSTLFNALLGERRSIVDEEPGTTRDYIAEQLEVDGVPVTLVDTAGLREEGGSVEIEGMRRTERQLGGADLILAVFEAGRGSTKIENRLQADLKKNKIEHILILNKMDKLSREEQETNYINEVIKISARTGEGLNKLRESIKEKLATQMLGSNELIITERRQQKLIDNALGLIQAAERLWRERQYYEVVLEELNAAAGEIGKITGKDVGGEVIGRIFEGFCIGK